ncbi:MAG: TIGR03619 family F420-dependent LLM class oxidoreductase [Bacillati bacterium ANGP1]|uniref:TIGR03619 family F420-dependent LLM class oxidoreductase n=1 Tax=Candidatus Segetimicrobium genomatis TaxID=2569760 RepID=A0A537LI15_9BACT|nr:MAG: TIGR03619 family F420-dependent LLM class oxidoreductase [Terrabacteria group bacterium ANGP1]
MGTIGIALPNLPGVTPPLIPEFARRIEAGGCDAIWALDRLVYENPDPLTALAAAAAVTSRVRLGTSVLLAPLHSPVVLAKQLATLDLVSNGRLLVGLGIGSRPDDFAAAGVPFAGRGGRAAEMIRIMKQVWSGQPVRHQGRYFAIECGAVGPAPVQRPHPPVWMGGFQEVALKRIARIADGFVGSGGVGPAGFAAMWERVRQMVAAAGRPPDRFPNACLAYFNVGGDREQAKAQAMAALVRYYGPQFMSRYDPERALVFGPPEECARRAQAYFDAGVQHLILVPTTLDAGQVDRIAREVRPHLRA